MHFPSAIVLALAAVGALATPFSLVSRGKKEECLEQCVSSFIRPFVMAASEEGFRQALGAHDTTTVCMESLDCRNTVQTFVDEITDMVMKDRTQGKEKGQPFHWPDGYHGEHCDSYCLVLTAQTAAGQAGVVAMAVGQKHFYGNNPLWNRWSPRQMIRLEDAMRQLNGLDVLGASFPSRQRNGLKTDKNGRSKFDHKVFRYQGTTEVSLLKRSVKRKEAQKILSHVKGYGCDMSNIDSAERNRGFLNGWAYREFSGRFSDMDRYPGPSGKELKAQKDALQKININAGDSKREGWLYFLYARRLSVSNAEGSSLMVPGESWRRLLEDAFMKLSIADPANLEAVDVDHADLRNWENLVYGVEEGFRPEPLTTAKSETTRLAQWVTNSQKTHLKGLDSDVTHQPWTVPWFYEYSTNVSTLAGLHKDMTADEAEAYMASYRKSHNAYLIRGYMMEFKLKVIGTFSPQDLFAENGAIKNFNDITLESPREDYSPLYAVTPDGHVLVRYTKTVVPLDDDKMAWEVLDHEKKPLYTHKGDAITIIYDKRTGLLETQYGMSIVPLDKDMEAWP